MRQGRREENGKAFTRDRQRGEGLRRRHGSRLCNLCSRCQQHKRVNERRPSGQSRMQVKAEVISMDGVLEAFILKGELLADPLRHMHRAVVKGG